MGNLRPAPAELTPMRVDMLLAALDQRERAYIIETLHRLGLTDDVIERLLSLSQRMNRKPLAIAGALLVCGLDAAEGRG
jgi:hypothetical protein